MGAWRQGWRRITVTGREGWRRIIKNASDHAEDFRQFRQKARLALTWSRFRTICEREETTFNVISTFSFGSYAVFKFHTSAPEFTRLVNAVEKIAGVQAPPPLPSAPEQSEETKEKDAPALPSSPEQSQSEETKEKDAPALPSSPEQSQPSEE